VVPVPGYATYSLSTAPHANTQSAPLRLLKCTIHLIFTVALKPGAQTTALSGQGAGCRCRPCAAGALAGRYQPSLPQPLPRLKLIPSPVFVTHLDGRPQLVDCNGPIRARRAEMGAADGLVGAPPPLHHALLQVVAREDACELHMRAEDQQMT
jgi:hypothetical protein